MGFEKSTSSNSTSVYLTSFFFLLFFLPSFLFGQTIEFISQDSDGNVSMIIKDMPPLSPVVRSDEARDANIPIPHYEYLWVFDDGEFINQSKDAEVSHIFIGPDGNTRQGTVMAFTTGVYSDDHLDLPPSARAVNGSSGSNDIETKAAPRQEVVTDGLIRLSSNQRGFVAGDKTVFIISVKNPNNFPLRGYLLFLSDPVIEKKTEGLARGEVNYEVYEDASGTPVSTTFSKRLDLDPLNSDFFLDSIPGQLFPTPLKGRYASAYRDPFITLDSLEERHLFVQFDVDDALFDKGPEEDKGALRFTAFFTVDQTAGPDNFLTPEDSTLIERLGIQALLDSLNGDDRPTGRLVADLSTFEGEITRSHDPNYIKTEACECPQGSDGAFKVFCTVHFSNEGNAATNDIAVSITFPEEYDIFSIPDTLLSIYPQPGTPILPDRDEATNTVRWNLAGFQIFPEAEYGVGNPLTYGEFQFTVLANPASPQMDSIPYLQACIEFDEAAPVCTVPVKPVAVESGDAARILACGTCVSEGPGGNTGGELPLPWWLLLLLLIILIILLAIAALRRRLFGTGG